jgi:hypothetical protein
MLAFTYKTFFLCRNSSTLEASISHIVRYENPVGLLCTSDQPVAEVATYTTNNKRNIDTLSENPTHDPSNEAAADLRLREHGQRDRQLQGNEVS